MPIPLAYIHGFLGGMLIGLAAVILLLFNGRIMGVSGIASNLFEKPVKDNFWRLAFILGLILGGWIWKQNFQTVIIINASWSVVVFAGLLVGFGTVMGGGCTSGHGICGMARFSKRSVIATIIFMLMGILTVWIKGKLGF